MIDLREDSLIESTSKSLLRKISNFQAYFAEDVADFINGKNEIIIPCYRTGSLEKKDQFAAIFLFNTGLTYKAPYNLDVSEGNDLSLPEFTELFKIHDGSGEVDAVWLNSYNHSFSPLNSCDEAFNSQLLSGDDWLHLVTMKYFPYWDSLSIYNVAKIKHDLEIKEKESLTDKLKGLFNFPKPSFSY